MKNFLRVLRYSWPYRGRLILSLVCAGLAVLLWSLNFAAITPVLTILTERKSLQDWVDEEIEKTQDKINKLQPVLKALRRADIQIVAIHQHMTGEVPRIMFLHYWGVGRAEALARGVRAALDQMHP